MQKHQWNEPFAHSHKTILGSTRVEVVPDNDKDAHPDIPRDVLEALGSNEVLMSRFGNMMYVRAATWERIKDRFPVQPS